MQPISLHFSGPLTFGAGDRCLFLSPYADAACVYLWTVQQEHSGTHLIHYVGETGNLAKRHREHLIEMLGLSYGVFDPATARRGESVMLWPGLWRDRSPGAPARAVEKYPELASVVRHYLDIMTVFVAPLDGDRSLRRKVEGAIAHNLRVNHEQDSVLYPPDNRTGVGERIRVKLEITADETIAGLDPTLMI